MTDADERGADSGGREEVPAPAARTDDVDERAAVAKRAAEAGAAVANEGFRSDIAVETKGEDDVVTEADRAAQRAVIESIRESYPDDAVVGEEEDERKTVPESGPAWVIDPIDGTHNYVRDIRVWATAVAAVVDGEPVAAAIVAPALGDTYIADAEGAYRNGEPIAVSGVTETRHATVDPTVWWEYDARDEYARACEAIVTRFGDMRRLGAAQVVLPTVAAGGLEGTITNVAANPWDTVAGVFAIRQAGGRVTDLDGNRWRHDSTGLVASNGALHDEVLAAANEIESD
ncbi:inositol monophosphatase family protein [Halorubrum ezzemoulense]|uniref:inositol monophosphatase family protein n=1 Tax=Halorubrum ezzemoulense TaxID=337243 RepID=UPI00232D2491|nr:inositol monophosphatase [Halorubrum ezzemoulense]MDB2281011.1 inositol monophosphatase [Halorubrum ezzemoulense]MDB9251625.1 inositol monophosphatase [Halorubrum ezzemoulense]MDB9256034.1 inositol monophosphatase [Halorubrum ezzemoulense]MDB9276745.1 inositol monophosphatase [Halorubrum ezzemoulense]